MEERDKEYRVSREGFIVIDGRKIEVLNYNNQESLNFDNLDFGYEFINIKPRERRFEKFKDHTSSKSVLSVCYKLADICWVIE